MQTIKPWSKLSTVEAKSQGLCPSYHVKTGEIKWHKCLSHSEAKASGLILVPHEGKLRKMGLTAEEYLFAMRTPNRRLAAHAFGDDLHSQWQADDDTEQRAERFRLLRDSADRNRNRLMLAGFVDLLFQIDQLQLDSGEGCFQQAEHGLALALSTFDDQTLAYR